MRFLYNPPSIIKYVFNDFKWNTKGGILLTFDDGPTPQCTHSILKKLDENKIKAVFFCVGNNIFLYPDLCREILKEGHSIGNHTYNHKIISKLNRKELFTELDLFNKLMIDSFNYKVKYFRPPHGRFGLSSGEIVRTAEIEMIMWSLITNDYRNDLKKVKYAVTKYLRSDSIVVLHDSIKSKDVILPAIDLILENAQLKNYSVESPSECLR